MKQQAGFTLVEVMIATAIMGLLVTIMMSMAFDTSALAIVNQAHHSVQTECNRVFSRLQESIETSGISTDADGQEYPFVDEDGALLFRLPDADDGEVVWEDESYYIHLDNNTVGLYDSNGTLLRTLGSLIKSIEFVTSAEDDTLQSNEVEVSVVVEKQLKSHTVSYKRTCTILLRN